jgi:hypothetical protein
VTQVVKPEAVSVRDRIAVVEYADDTEVHALLSNRSVLRIGRKEIVWDERNMRWETDANAAFECLVQSIQ